MRTALPCVLALAMVAGCHSSGRERPASQADAPQSGCVRPPEQSIPPWNPPPAPRYPAFEVFEDWTREIGGYLPREAASPDERRTKRDWMRDAVHLLRELRKGADERLCDSLEWKIRRFSDDIPSPRADSLTDLEKSRWLALRLELIERERTSEGRPEGWAPMREYLLKLVEVTRQFWQDAPRTEAGAKALEAYEAKLQASPPGRALSTLSTHDQGEWLDARLARLRESFPEAEKYSLTGSWLQHAAGALEGVLLRARAEQFKQVDRGIDELERAVEAE